MVQKTSMSRGPYPSSQEIPMEVFDPSPQVRRGGRDRGKGACPPDPVGSDRGGPGKKGLHARRPGERAVRPPALPVND